MTGGVAEINCSGAAKTLSDIFLNKGGVYFKLVHDANAEDGTAGQET